MGMNNHASILRGPSVLLHMREDHVLNVDLRVKLVIPITFTEFRE